MTLNIEEHAVVDEGAGDAAGGLPIAQKQEYEIIAVFISFFVSFWKILILQGGVNPLEFAY